MKHFRDLFVSVQKIWKGVESQQISLLACLSTELKKKLKKKSKHQTSPHGSGCWVRIYINLHQHITVLVE